MTKSQILGLMELVLEVDDLFITKDEETGLYSVKVYERGMIHSLATAEDSKLETAIESLLKKSEKRK